MKQDANKWLVTALGLTVAAAGALLFAAAVGRGPWPAAVVGAVSLWWVGAGLAVALSAVLSRSGAWPRDRRARYVAGVVALAVGGWIGSDSLPWAALAVLPLYALVERLIAAQVMPSDAAGVYVRLNVWLAYIVSGELLGYVIAAWAVGTIR